MRQYPLPKTKALVGTSLAVTTAHAPLDGTARTADLGRWLFGHWRVRNLCWLIVMC